MAPEQHTEHTRQQCVNMLREMIDEIRVAMLTTVAEDGHMRSRPMQTPPQAFDGDLWFFTLGTDPKTTEIRHHSHVCVTYASPREHQFLSLSGVAEIVADRKRIELIWNDELLEWFPAGADDPDLMLIRVRVNEAEFWHYQNKRFGAIRSWLSKNPTVQHSHERLQWQDDARPVSQP